MKNSLSATADVSPLVKRRFENSLRVSFVTGFVKPRLSFFKFPLSEIYPHLSQSQTFKRIILHLISFKSSIPFQSRNFYTIVRFPFLAGGHAIWTRRRR